MRSQDIVSERLNSISAAYIELKAHSSSYYSQSRLEF